MTDVNQLDADLNQMILSRKALDAFEKYYAEDVVMQENTDEPRNGKDINREYEKAFFASVKEFHGAELVASAIQGDTSFSQWLWDLTLEGAGRVQMHQVAVRSWRNGLVAHERFFHNKG